MSGACEINGVWRLNPDTTERRGIRGYRECSIGHGIEQGNDLTDRVVTSRDCHLLVIRIRDNVRRVHVVEHDRFWSKENSHGSDVSDVRILVLVRIDPGE